MASLSPHEESKLREAIRENIFPETDEILDFIDDNLDPGDVFSEDVLKEWALNNGFVEEHLRDDPREEAFTIGERNPSLAGG